MRQRTVSGLKSLIRGPIALFLLVGAVAVASLVFISMTVTSLHSKPVAKTVAGRLVSITAKSVLRNLAVNSDAATRQASRNPPYGSEVTAPGSAGFPVPQEIATRVYVGVMTHSGNWLRRQAIREGWGADPGLYRLRFFLLKSANETLAQQIERETLAYHDIVRLPFVYEQYSNTGNTTLEIMRFASSDPLVTHVLKVDDDVYLRPQLLIDLLPTLSSANLYLGEFVQWWCKSMATAECGATPPPDTKTRLFMSARYACGGGYLLSADLARAFAAVASFHPQISSNGTLMHGSPSMCSGHHPILTPFVLEDMMMGCWLDWLERSGNVTIHRVHEPRFQTQNNKERACSEDAIAMHGVSADRQRCMAMAGGQCNCDAFMVA